MFDNSLIIYFLLCSLIVESLVFLFKKSYIFLPVRLLIYKLNFKYLNYLIECGYCLSVWFSTLVTLIFYIDNSLPNIFNCDSILIIFCILITHRLSNIIHFIIDFLHVNSRFKDN